MTVVAILFLAAYIGMLALVLRALGQGKLYFLLIYLASFLPIYTVFLSFIYDHTESLILIQFIQYSKEFVLVFGLLLWFFGQSKGPLYKAWHFSFLDWLFILFGTLSFIYMLLPLGEASLIAKITYFKNIFLMCLVYLFGRQVKIYSVEWRRVFKVIFVVTSLAFVVVLAEKLFSTHFHTMIGYAKYHQAVQDIEPTGNFGLNWTFEAQGGQPRYGAFFSNPLEFAASMLIVFALAIIHLLSMQYNANRVKYISIVFFTIVCVLLAFSRATMLTFIVTLTFMAFLLRYYKLLTSVGIAILSIVIYVWFLAPDDTRYFVEDTISFQNSSSITHVIEWLEGVESMVENPFGIGLAMSGNAGSVDDDLKVGGENQFLIYGVQLGIFGLLIYLFMLGVGIRDSWKAFRWANSREEQIIPFVAASVKFGLLLPLFTANAEIYLYVALVSWWFVGYSESLYQAKLRKMKGR
ncbi:O-antigen ligase family protein [Roseivirga echinicomitans]